MKRNLNEARVLGCVVVGVGGSGGGDARIGETNIDGSGIHVASIRVSSDGSACHTLSEAHRARCPHC